MAKLFQARAWERLSKEMESKAKENPEYAKIQKIMWELSSEEYSKGNNAEDVADVITDFVNSSVSDTDELAERLAKRTHKTLQQEVFRLFRKCVNIWSDADKDEWYDARNEATVKQSTIIKEALKDEGLPFI